MLVFKGVFAKKVFWLTSTISKEKNMLREGPWFSDFDKIDIDI